MSELPSISVIIATYHREESLMACLESVMAQDYAGRMEIIVVEQGRRRPHEALDFFFFLHRRRITRIEQQEPNLPRARNTGVAAASGEVLLFVDDDITLPSHVIRRLAKHFRGSRVKAVTGLILSEIDREGSLQSYARQLGVTRVEEAQEPVHVDEFIGALMMVSAKTVDAVSGFDPNLGDLTPTAYGEDNDFCQRLRQAGVQLLVDPDVRVLHRDHLAGGCGSRQTDRRLALKYHMKSMVYIRLKHHGRLGVAGWLQLVRGYIANRETLRNGPRQIIRNLMAARKAGAEVRSFMADCRSASGSLSGRPYRLAILISHPIQYFAPLFRKLARQPETDLTVLYCSLQGARTMRDPGFGVSFAWDIPLLEGYHYKALRNYWPGQLKGFFSYINPGVFREFRKGAYDAVMVFGWGSLSTWLAFGGAWLAGVPWMLYGDTNFLSEKGSRGLRFVVRRMVLSRLFCRTSAFLASGSFNRMFYESMGVPATHCFRVPMAVDNRAFVEASGLTRGDRKQAREKYGISPNLTLVLFSGKLAPHKRPGDLLKALQALQGELPLLGCVFVGDGVLRSRLQEEASRLNLANVFFLGFRNQSELGQIYACADCLVLPSETDARGVVVNEAMACGLPVIVSDRTGVWGPGDIVREGENGFVYPSGDVRALAAAVRKLVNDPDLRLRMGERSFEIIQDFTYEKCTGGILEALKSVVAARYSQEQ